MKNIENDIKLLQNLKNNLEKIETFINGSYVEPLWYDYDKLIDSISEKYENENNLGLICWFIFENEFGTEGKKFNGKKINNINELSKYLLENS